MTNINVKGLTVALISGTGRMGVHLSAAWAHAGMDVLMCSRDKSKAQAIVDSLLAGQGYSVGDIMVPPTPVAQTKNWKLRAGSLEDAASAKVIVLSSPFHVMWPILEPLAPALRGQGKIFLDLTNPWLNTSNSKDKTPIPLDEPQASVLVHKQRFHDPTSSWCMAYRHVFWALVHPTGPNPRTGKNVGIEVIGDDAAVATCAAMMTSHGFRPHVIPGDLNELAPNYEIAFTGRVRKGKEGCPPPVGSGQDGLVGPFTASPMIAFDIMGEKFSRLFSRKKCKETDQPADPLPEAVAFVEAESSVSPEDPKKKDGTENDIPTATATPIASYGANEIGANVNIAKSAKIGMGVKIGPNTHVHDGVVIGDGVTIGQNCHVHMNAKIETGATLEDNCHVHMNATMRAETVLKKGKTIQMNKTN